jgi:hypothetical protein
MPSLQSGMNVGQDRFWNMFLKQVRDGVYKIAKSAYYICPVRSSVRMEQFGYHFMDFD